MSWVDNLFGALKEGFSFFKQERDPEVKRQIKIERLENERLRKIKERDNLVVKQLETNDEEKKLRLGIELGIVTNELIELRDQIAAIKR